MTVVLRLLTSPALSLVRDVVGTIDVPPDVVAHEGRRYLRDKTRSDYAGDVLVLVYVEERTFNVSTDAVL